MKTFTSILIITGLLFVTTTAQNCGCSPDMCCSQYGYCGSDETYCGTGCQQGPCFTSGSPPTNDVSVDSILTDAFFNGIIDQSDSSCQGRGFYSRAAFLDAVRNYPNFGSVGSVDDLRRQIATFFAHVTHETGHFCYIEQINGPAEDYCDVYNTEYPCNPSKGYFGRGPLQLSWNYNYGSAGQSIGFDGLNNPEVVATDPTISFRVALWFWMNNVQSVIGQGFGATIRAINGLECNGGNSAAVTARVGYYTQYCDQLGVAPGDNLQC